MSRIAYVNGRYLPFAQATVHVEDRGYQFSDGVYEVCEVKDGRMVDEPLHMRRLQRSLGELKIAMPMSLAALRVVLRETVRRNRVRDGLVYLQVSRGVARRDHAFPPAGTAPSVVVTARSTDPSARRAHCSRWRRGHHRAGEPLGAGRHQSHRAAAECARQAGSEGAGRQGSLVRRQGWLCDGRLVLQCLDRQPRRQGDHPAGRPRHPARGDAHGAAQCAEGSRA